MAEVWAEKIYSTVHYIYRSSLENIISCVRLAKVWAEKLTLLLIYLSLSKDKRKLFVMTLLPIPVGPTSRSREVMRTKVINSPLYLPVQFRKHDILCLNGWGLSREVMRTEVINSPLYLPVKFRKYDILCLNGWGLSREVMRTEVINSPLYLPVKFRKYDILCLIAWGLSREVMRNEVINWVEKLWRLKPTIRTCQV